MQRGQRGSSQFQSGGFNEEEIGSAAKAVRILLIEDNAADVDLMKYALDKGTFHMS